MASTSNLLDTKTLTLNDILGNGKIYHVPQYQRDYSWEQDNWEALWADIVDAYHDNCAHYMGSIVLQIKGSESDKQYWIIDGQQRFSTLSILILAAIDKINKMAEAGNDAENNMERADLLMKQYIGQKDPSSLSYSSKLVLNEHSDGFYQQRLLHFKQPISYAKLNDAEKLLWDAFEYYRNQIDSLFPEENGEKIAAFLTKTVGESLKFIQITVTDELNAYTVFETLNSRRVELTATDLLKNFLFSLVSKSPSDLQMVKAQWKKIIDAIGLNKFPVFLRYFLNTKNTLVKQAQLFKSIKKTIKTAQDVIDLLEQLEKFAYIYNALYNPEDELWGGDKEIKEDIGSLNLFRVSMCQPLLMIAFDKLDLTAFRKVLNAIVAISFRYNVIGKLQTNEMEKAYNNTAVKVYTSMLTTAAQVIDDLKDLYLDDDTFKRYFELKSINTSNSQQKKIARYILYKIEGQLPGGIKTDYAIDDGTIEHILPENMNAHWREIFNDEEHLRNVYMLGNLSLLETSKNNKEAAQKPFADKLKVYQTSRYALSNRITGTDWNIKMIQHRQANLAKTACGIWKI
jgi:uncharacterized protein with ParB-like and HNH nuclease domain